MMANVTINPNGKIQKEFFQLKELEKIASKQKGIGKGMLISLLRSIVSIIDERSCAIP